MMMTCKVGVSLHVKNEELGSEELVAYKIYFTLEQNAPMPSVVSQHPLSLPEYTSFTRVAMPPFASLAVSSSHLLKV